MYSAAVNQLRFSTIWPLVRWRCQTRAALYVAPVTFVPDISYISQVIANFVLNFVAMATRVARGKIRLATFDGPFPKTPL